MDQLGSLEIRLAIRCEITPACVNDQVTVLWRALLACAGVYCWLRLDQILIQELFYKRLELLCEKQMLSKLLPFRLVLDCNLVGIGDTSELVLMVWCKERSDCLQFCDIGFQGAQGDVQFPLL